VLALLSPATAALPAIPAAPLKTSAVVKREPAGGPAGGEVVRLASGIELFDQRVGGGQVPERGAEVLAHVRGFLNEKGDPVFIDTFADNAPILFNLGVRPPGISEGLEQAIASMRTGGRCAVQVPAYLGYPEGVAPAEVKPPLKRAIPTRTMLRYVVELLRCTEEGICCPDPLYPCKVPEVSRS